MKTRELSELLVERPVVHPTWIDDISWRGRNLTIKARGYRWWEEPDVEQKLGTQYSLCFRDVGVGCLLTDEFDVNDDEALEDLEVVLTSELPWAQPCEWSIYCSGPIGQPLTLFGRLHDYLRSVDAFLKPERFFNQAADLSGFAAMARSSGFLVGSVPSCIRDLVCDELHRQSVPHNVVRTVAGTKPKFLVRLGDSAFFCESALAELPG